MHLFKKEPELPKLAALHAATAFLYIAFLTLVGGGSSLGRSLEKEFPPELMALTMLSILVFSAAVMAMVFFFRPVAYLIEGKKKEAALFVGWTMLFFFVYVVGALMLAKLFII